MAFGDAIKSGSKRRNVSPTSSTLKMVTEDIDCSGLTAAPEDGEFIVANPAAPQGAGAGLTLSDNDAANIAAAAQQLRMVWGSARRSDRQALGDQCVSVIQRGGGRFMTKVFLSDAGTTPSADGYAAGGLLTVIQATPALAGATGRMLLAPIGEAANAHAICVGQIIRVANNSGASGTAELEIEIWDAPRIVKKA